LRASEQKHKFLKLKKMSCFIGIDGGGTKTRAIVIDNDRKELAEGISGASNQNSVGSFRVSSSVLTINEKKIGWRRIC
jgi:N-acetylglucosamine kinase-like BadF-type ATPase